jgi:nucleoside-diphosphate kinase
MAIENSLVLIKPDGLQKGVSGDIISQLSLADLKIVGMKITKVDEEVAKEHYKEHKEKPFFQNLIDFITGKHHVDRVIAIIYQGEDAIKKIRDLAGTTHPEKANPGTIRAKYGRIHSETEHMENVMHASDSIESSEREIKIWFKPSEITQDLYPTTSKTIESEVTAWA